MIRYPYDPVVVDNEVAHIDPKWAEKTATRTAKFVAQRRFKEASSIWSTVKPVFMKLQHNKCIFCERQFEDAIFGPVEWDLEHFRPKSNVAAWPVPSRHGDLNYGQDLGPASSSGYFWLAYDLRNYAASCKVCNTRFKLNYFPVCAARAQVGLSRQALGAERPLLCYPLGDLDEDPEDLVTFVLTTAVPASAVGDRALRGRVIIDFFGLNIRDVLHRDRARMIAVLGAALDDRDRGRASPRVHAMIDRMLEPHMPHAACVRAFHTLWSEDPATARRGYDACRLFGFDPGAAPPSL